jgi:hypothetical protein
MNTSEYSGCFKDYFKDFPKDRVVPVETGSQDQDVLGPHQTKSQPIALLFTDNQIPLGAIVFNFINSSELFKVQTIVDGECQPITSFANDSIAGSPSTLQNWNTLGITIGVGRYALRLGHSDGVIEVNYFRSVEL